MSGRRSIRYKGYDYTEPGYYFVTICIKHGICELGRVRENAVKLSRFGQIVDLCWLNLPRFFPSLRLDAYVVMPNHFHGILHIVDEFSALASNGEVLGKYKQARGTYHSSVAAIIQNFKSVSTRRINAIRKDRYSWQRNYYEHIIRNERNLNLIRLYIKLNPRMWETKVKLNELDWSQLETVEQLLQEFQPDAL